MTATSTAIDLDGPAVVVEFGAPWCGPCKQLEPILVELKKKVEPTVRVISLNLDLDEDAEIARRFNIRAAGVVLILKNGQVVDQFTGPKPLNAIIQLLVDRELLAA